MDYKETIEYLYSQAPLFQQVGNKAYKEGLENTLALDAHTGHPHREFRTIHVAGTNGKGSTSHTLAAILQSSGLKVGLYTSPHLLDFRERIRVNGTPIPEDYVIKFIEENRSFTEPLHPSFFEVTTAMAFRYFADSKVDVAVIEVGLGGRLDCTNIITPDLSIITSIGFDHTQFLGNTLAEIASEKAGIIKPGIPVVIGEVCKETRPVFQAKAEACNSRIVFSTDNCKIISASNPDSDTLIYHTEEFGDIKASLTGDCQRQNAETILTAVQVLKEYAGYSVSKADVLEGFCHTTDMTGLHGRWETVAASPRIICDTGHNSHGLKHIARQLDRLHRQNGGKLGIVFGMVNDKDVNTVLELMPKDAAYYFTQASVHRAIPAEELRELAAGQGLAGASYPSVESALQAARNDLSEADIIFVGGSSYVVADLFAIEEFRFN